jgi:hypothetical protein
MDLWATFFASFEAWIIDNDGSDCEKKFHNLFRFDTHLKVKALLDLELQFKEIYCLLSYHFAVGLPSLQRAF